MDIRVGSLADPAGHQGLAHFLEHMLFLGTEKYPQVGEYDKYLAEFQGYHNAFTAREHTNYHFEVNHDGFRGALDRFGQFFISPCSMPNTSSESCPRLIPSTRRTYRMTTGARDRSCECCIVKATRGVVFSTGDRETLKTPSQRY